MGYNLFLDDYRNPDHVTWVSLPQVEWTIARSYQQFVETIAANGFPDFIAYDHDLSRQHMLDYFDVCEIEDQILDPLKLNYAKYKEKTGYDCAKWLISHCLAHNKDIPPYIVHSKNHIGRRNITDILENAKSGIDYVRKNS